MASARAVIGIWEAAIKAQELLSFFGTNRQPTFHIQHISRQDKAVFFRPDSPGVRFTTASSHLLMIG
jgi:hypothetical protein